MRWELSANGHTAYSTAVFPSVGLWGGPGTNLDVIDSVVALNGFDWPTSYTQLAPRFGLAYHLRVPDVVVHAGVGLFYDTDLASLVNPVNASPSNLWQFSPAGIGKDVALPPSYSVPPATLSLPRAWEWRTSLEKEINGSSTLSLSYLGSPGRRLLRDEVTLDPQTGLLTQSTFTSYGESDYEALQLQFMGNVRPSFYVLVSYTWGHSLDNGSQSSSLFLMEPGYNRAADRGSSDFDIGHNFTASLNYRMPSWNAYGLAQTGLGKWNLSATLDARSGFPFDVTTVDRSIGLDFANSGRPDVISGVPLWTDIGELNPGAFRPSSGGINGTLGRNVLTGPSLIQIDASLRRQFRLFRGAALETSVSAFNLFNRANFANPSNYVGSPLFGRALSLQNLMLGSGTPTTGATPVFESGGPRTVELRAKFSF